MNAFELSEGAPARIIAGDGAAFKRSDLSGDYPLDAYSFAFTIAPKSGGHPVQWTVGADGGAPTFTLVDADIAPGDYVTSLKATRTSDGAVRTIETGAMRVAAGVGGDTRSEAVRMIAAIDAVIAGRIDKDVAAYSIDGRSVTRIPIGELRELRKVYARRVARERGQGGGAKRVRRV